MESVSGITRLGPLRGRSLLLKSTGGPSGGVSTAQSHPLLSGSAWHERASAYECGHRFLSLCESPAWALLCPVVTVCLVSRAFQKSCISVIQKGEAKKCKSRSIHLEEQLSCSERFILKITSAHPFLFNNTTYKVPRRHPAGPPSTTLPDPNPACSRHRPHPPIPHMPAYWRGLAAAQPQ